MKELITLVNTAWLVLLEAIGILCYNLLLAPSEPNTPDALGPLGCGVYGYYTIRGNDTINSSIGKLKPATNLDLEAALIVLGLSAAIGICLYYYMMRNTVSMSTKNDFFHNVYL